MNNTQFKKKTAEIDAQITDLSIKRKTLNDTLAPMREEVEKFTNNLKVVGPLLAKAEKASLDAMIKDRKTEIKKIETERDQVSKEIVAKESEVNRLRFAYRNLSFILTDREVKSPSDYVLSLFYDDSIQLTTKEIVQTIKSLDPMIPVPYINSAIATLVKTNKIKKIMSNSKKFALVPEEISDTVRAEVINFFKAPHTIRDFLDHARATQIVKDNSQSTKQVLGLCIAYIGRYSQKPLTEVGQTDDGTSLYQFAA